MATINFVIDKEEVYGEVGKATDYTGSKMADGDERTRERILASDEELADLGRMWDESALTVNERFKSMVRNVEYTSDNYTLELEVSNSFDQRLTHNVEACIKGFFIASITGQWFKYADKEDAAEWLQQAAEMLTGAERLLYSRRRPVRPAR